MEQLKESDLLIVLVVLCQHVQHPLMTPLAPSLLEIVHSILSQFQVENVIQSTDPSNIEQQEKSKMVSNHAADVWTHTLQLKCRLLNIPINRLKDS